MGADPSYAPTEAAATKSRSAPIIAFSNNSWDETVGSTVQSLLPRLAARGWPVVHSTGALNVWERASKDWAKAGLMARFETIDGVQIERAGKSLLCWPRFPAWNELVVRLHAARLPARVARADERVIVIAYHPRFYPYVRRLRSNARALFVFHSIDNYLDQPGATAELRTLLERCIAAADLLIANNATGAARLPGAGPQKARLLPSGVDLPVVLAGLGQGCPAELAAIPPPRIGYVGRINPKVDFAVIATTAMRHPDWHWVLIGDLIMHPGNAFYSAIAEAWETCRRLPNVHFLGPKPFRTVSTYLEHMNVNTICYRLDAGAWTRAAYPFKIHECLAVGRPVVCAAMPEVQARHGNVMDFATTPDEWEAAIARAIGSGGIGTPALRRAVAAQNTSDQRADQLESWLRELAANAPPAQLGDASFPR